MKLWAGQTVSTLGSRFTGLAIQISAAVSLGATPAEMGVLAAVDTAPYLLVGLFTGVWVDRHRRRSVLVWSDLGRALLLATIPAAALAGTLSLVQLYAVGFLTGALGVCFDVAYQSYLPAIVSRDQLVEANGKLTASASAASVAGLSAAGVVIQTIGAPLAILLDACSYVASAVSVLLIRRCEAAVAASGTSALAEAREGIGIVLGNPLLRALLGCSATSNFFSSGFFALYILFGTRELGLGAPALGLVYGVGTAGALAGGVLADRAAARLGVGRAVVLTALVGGAEVLPAVFAAPDSAVPLLLLSSVVGYFGWSLHNVIAASLRQAIVPLFLQGRASATQRFVVAGMLPLGGLLGGAVGESLGLRAAIALAAGGSLLSFLWVLSSSARSLARFPNSTPPG